MPYNLLIDLVILITVSEGLYVQNSSISRAIAECFARLSHGLGVRLSVCPSHSAALSKRYNLGSRNLYRGLPQGLVYRLPGCRGSHRTRTSKRGTQ